MRYYKNKYSIFHDDATRDSITIQPSIYEIGV